ARQKLKDNRETTLRQEEIVNRLKNIRQELLSLKSAFDLIEPKG
ncbi:MAG: transcriptional regulator, partial [Tannerellaceae bacterium]|nr:transcriptional regulator [Tannerellaceae bacterium]